MPEALPDPLPTLIAHKRDGGAWTETEIRRWVRALVARAPAERLSDEQVGALAMAVVLRGMDRAEAVALTLAMRDSGRVLRWPDAPGPVLDKHSTGGVGDKISLMLAPMLAACGAVVPMISGRGLAHTGGTLDKLEAIPGYTVRPSLARLRAVMRQAGAAIVAAGGDLAPADRRLYAVRDRTATVESQPLIVASILSKKLAAGLQGLVMDVKVGEGAFLPARDDALRLAQALVRVGRAAGLPVQAALTPMDQPLAPCAGNALEVRLTLDLLRAGGLPAACRLAGRLLEVTRALAVEALCLGGLCPDRTAAAARLDAVWTSGEVAERFGRMVAGLGGPADLLERPAVRVPTAPVCRPWPAPAPAGRLTGLDTRAIGWAVVQLGRAGRLDSAPVDPRTGISGLAALGTVLRPGDPIGQVHAPDDATADAVIARLKGACRFKPESETAAAAAGLPLFERVDLPSEGPAGSPRTGETPRT